MSRILNGINLDVMESVLGRIKEIYRDPSAASQLNKRRARILWDKGLRCKVLVGQHKFIVDESIEGGNLTETPTTMEYLLGSLGACVMIGFVYNATREGIAIHQIEVTLEGEIDNILNFLGLSSEGHAGYREIRMTLYVEADADKKRLEEILARTLETSPVGSSLTRHVELRARIA